MKRAVPVTVVVVSALLVGLLAYGVAARGGDGGSLDAKLARGERVEAAVRALPALRGAGTRSLADFRGRVVVLNFWASWCDPCKREAPVLAAAQRMLARQGGTVLGVDYKDAVSDARAFARRHGLTFPMVRDPDGRYAAAFGTRSLPETFVIDREGRIVTRQRGTVDRAWIERAVAPVLRERA